MSMELKPEICVFRHKNGNCTSIGGFCTAVNENICFSVVSAYNRGYADGRFFEWKKHREEKQP